MPPGLPEGAVAGGPWAGWRAAAGSREFFGVVPAVRGTSPPAAARSHGKPGLTSGWKGSSKSAHGGRGRQSLTVATTPGDGGGGGAGAGSGGPGTAPRAAGPGGARCGHAAGAGAAGLGNNARGGSPGTGGPQGADSAAFAGCVGKGAMERLRP